MLLKNQRIIHVSAYMLHTFIYLLGNIILRLKSNYDCCLSHISINIIFFLLFQWQNKYSRITFALYLLYNKLYIYGIKFLWTIWVKLILLSWFSGFINYKENYVIINVMGIRRYYSLCIYLKWVKLHLYVLALYKM